MNSTQNQPPTGCANQTAQTSPKPSSPNNYAALIAFDWADKKHDMLLRDQAANTTESFVIENSPEQIHQHLRSLQMRFEHKPIAVFFEAHRGPLSHALADYENFHLFALNPRSVTCLREALHPSKSKNDKRDTAVILEFGRGHVVALKPLEPNCPLTKRLDLLSQQRRNLVDQRTAALNQLTALLKEYYPQALDLAGELDRPLAWAYLERFPQLSAVKKARPETIRKFYYQQHGRSQKLIAQRLEIIAGAEEITRDPVIQEVRAMMAMSLVKSIRALSQGIAAHDKELEKQTPIHPDAGIFRSLPGAGACLTPRLIAAFGSDRQRWSSETDLACHSGVAPVQRQSGQGNRIRMRAACNKYLRQTFIEHAGCSIKYSPWAKDFYDEKKALGWKHNRILRALAYKWIRIMYRMWQDRAEYDASKVQREAKKAA